MSHAVFYCSFELKKGADVNAFLQAAKKLNDEHICKQPGYVSWKQLLDGDMWADFATFETMDDVKNFEKNSANAGRLAEDFYSYINFNTIRQHYFTIERNHGSVDAR